VRAGAEGRPVSRVHRGLVWDDEGGRHELLDFASHNGTFVNGVRTRSRHPLAPGDRVRVVDHVLVFEPDPSGTG
jgi:pSer/pThr/pTyr-binding forkhead associated (FHA) protein